ncbi:MAG: hypothetical protein CVU88_02850 [Firmicutes bacterium HGW-Firmicutes-13]|nr:MAG: hypothetical protein CVU88_02850 [Firmicutes bacterium HGW-Firmicutes-13]
MSGNSCHKEFFPGGNTYKGFFSLYDSLLKKGRYRTFIFKGGPGTGKSTIMKKVGKALTLKGYKVEYYYCSSDTGSLDGIAVPGLGIVIVDGTAPHVIDPVIPGARDEIINLGAYWKEEMLKPYITEIKDLQDEITFCFNTAYHYLKEAWSAYRQWQFYYHQCTDQLKYKKTLEDLHYEIFDEVPSRETLSEEQHFFASAITPDGLVNKYPLILSSISNFHLLLGDPGTGKSAMLKNIYDTGRQKGLKLEVYHCGFAPERLDALVLPEISTVVIKSTYPHNFSLSETHHIKKILTYDLSAGLDLQKVKALNSDINDVRERYWRLIGKAVKSIKKAKLNHDHLEDYYKKAQNYEALNKLAETLLHKILDYKYVEAI